MQKTRKELKTIETTITIVSITRKIFTFYLLSLSKVIALLCAKSRKIYLFYRKKELIKLCLITNFSILINSFALIAFKQLYLFLYCN